MTDPASAMLEQALTAEVAPRYEEVVGVKVFAALEPGP